MMKLLAVLAVMLTGAAVVSYPLNSKTYQWSTSANAGIVTANSPTSATPADAGFNLQDIQAFRVTVCAASTDGGPNPTLSGGGSVDAYVRNDIEGMVGQNPSLNLAVSVTTTSCNGAPCTCQTFPDLQVGTARGVYFPTANSIIVDGGTGVNIYVEGVKR